MTYLLAALLAAFVAPLAPAPPHRPKPPPEVGAGQWVLTWEQAGGRITLAPSGAYHCRWGASDWYGSWAWEAKARTLHVRESSDGVSWLSWDVRLDERLQGEATVGARQVRVHLRRARK
jgi:hypothetical protein